MAGHLHRPLTPPVDEPAVRDAAIGIAGGGWRIGVRLCGIELEDLTLVTPGGRVDGCRWMVENRTDSVVLAATEAIGVAVRGIDVNGGIFILLCVCISPPGMSADVFRLDPRDFDADRVSVEAGLEGVGLKLHVGDLDGDGQPEVVARTVVNAPWERCNLMAYEFTQVSLELKWHRRFLVDVELLAPWYGDLDGDGGEDFAIVLSDSLGHTLEIWNFEGERLFSRFARMANGGAVLLDGSPVPGPCLDLTGDGRRDLVWTLNAGWSSEPRAIEALDVATGDVIWSTPIGSMVLGQLFVLNADPDPDDVRIAVGGWGVGNGAVAGGMSDCCAWFILLDGNGVILEADSLGGKHSAVVFANRTGRGPSASQPYFGIGGTGDSPWARYGVYRFAPDGRVERFASLPNMAGPFLVSQLRPDPEVEIVTQLSDEPTLKVYSADLAEIATWTFDRAFRFLGTFDVVGDDLDEVVLSTRDGWVFILDNDLRPLIAIDSGLVDPGLLWPIARDDGGSRIALAGGGHMVVARVVPVTHGPSVKTYLYALSGIVIGLAAVLGLRAYRRMRPGSRRQPPQPLEPVAGDRIARFEVLDRLGAGAMGVVYRARDPMLGREVAVKLIRPELSGDPVMQRRFLKECRAEAMVNHVGVATLYEAGELDDGRLYFVAELVDGKTLKDLLARGRLAIGVAVDLALNLAEALAALHREGIVHRDIKPGNLMVTDAGVLKVLDFGIARLVSLAVGRPSEEETTITRTSVGVMIGTPDYMSPEQASGHAVDARSDVFSAGSVIYEMVCGKAAFRAPSPAEALRRVLTEDPPAADAVDPRLPPGLARILQRAMAKDPRRRYASGTEFANALRDFRRGFLSETP